ncbi:MAG: Mrp/NBP35 family ATP-binding protein [Bdellovibrionales bacterium]|nr:Mrp/NBP35 family ATP-binding protein [Bdellovibrionales bacterium]
MAQSTSVDLSALQNALRSVIEPDQKKDLVTLGMIENLDVNPNGDVRLKVVLTTPAHPEKTAIETAVREAIARVPGVKSVNVTMDAKVRGANRHVAAGAAPGKGVAAIEGVANIIAVSSGKGGVGKSTVAVNLATSLALEGARVGLMDTDVYGPNIPTMMGVTEQPKILNHPTKGEFFIPPVAHGVKVMSMGFLVDPDQPLVWRGPMLHSVITQFCHQVEWGNLDYLIVDMPPGTGDVQLSLAQMVPVTGAILVSTPQEVAMQDVRKAYAMFDKVRVPMIGVVENMSYFQPEDSDKKYYIFGHGGGKILADKFRTELLAQIPIVPAVREGGDTGRPITVATPGAPTSVAFRTFAKRVAQKVAIMAAEGIDPASIIQIGRFN